MKKILFVFTLVIGMHVSAQTKDEALKKDVLTLIEKSGGAGPAKAAKAQLLTMIPAEKHAAFIVEFDQSLPALYDKMADVYMEVYTKEDIKAMLAFYDSPLGKKMSERSADIFTKSQVAAKDWSQGLQALVMKYMQ